MRIGHFSIRPWRFLYLMVLAVVAYATVGALGVVFVTLASIDDGRRD